MSNPVRYFQSNEVFIHGIYFIGLIGSYNSYSYEAISKNNGRYKFIKMDNAWNFDPRDEGRSVMTKFDEAKEELECLEKWMENNQHVLEATNLKTLNLKPTICKFLFAPKYSFCLRMGGYLVVDYDAKSNFCKLLLDESNLKNVDRNTYVINLDNRFQDSVDTEEKNNEFIQMINGLVSFIENTNVEIFKVENWKWER